MIERLSRVLAVFALLGGTAWAGSMNGVAGSMPAYYDATLFTINFMELASGGEAANLPHNGSINTIYMCDPCEGQLPGGGPFVSGRAMSRHAPDACSMSQAGRLRCRRGVR